MKSNNNIRIEEVADVNYVYPYLEVFYRDTSMPFLEISITDKKELNFKLYPNMQEVNISESELEYIINSAKKFLPEALKNEEDFQKFNEK